MAIASTARRPGSLSADIMATLNLAWPMILAQVGLLGIIMTDTLMVGRLGADALASISIGVAVFDVFFLFAMGLTTAVPALASRAHGAHQPRRLRQIVRQGFWVALLASVPMLVVLSFGEPIMLLLGQEPAVAAGAGRYLRGVMWMLPFSLCFLVLRGFVASVGRPRPVLWVLLGGLALNAALDYALIFGNWGFPRWELAGAGIATTLTSIATLAGLLAYAVFVRPFRRYGILRRLWRSDWPLFWELIAVGTPIGLTILFEAGIFIAAAFLMGLIGAEQLAAHQTAGLTAALMFMIPLGISQAATVRVGNAIGAAAPKARELWTFEHGARGRAAARRAGLVPIVIGLCISVVTGSILWFWPSQIVGLYLDIDDPANARVVDFAISFMRIAAIFQLVDAAQGVSIGALRGLADTRIPMLFGLLGFWGVGFPTSVVLGFWLGFDGIGIWIGLAAGLTVFAIPAMIRFFVLTAAAAPGKVPRDVLP